VNYLPRLASNCDPTNLTLSQVVKITSVSYRYPATLCFYVLPYWLKIRNGWKGKSNASWVVNVCLCSKKTIRNETIQISLESNERKQ
jgi:hypothetical protein